MVPSAFQIDFIQPFALVQINLIHSGNLQSGGTQCHSTAHLESGWNPGTENISCCKVMEQQEVVVAVPSGTAALLDSSAAFTKLIIFVGFNY